MCIQDIHEVKETGYPIYPPIKEQSSCTLIDKVNQQSVTTLFPQSDKSDETKSKEELIQELTLARRHLTQMQVNTYKEALSIIQQLTERNKVLTQKNEALSHLLTSEKDKFLQLKTLVEPALKHIMEDVTQKLVTKLMSQVPDLHQLVEKSTKENGTINFELLLESLEAKSKQIEEVGCSDDLCEWQEIVELDIEEAFEVKASSSLPLTHQEQKVNEKEITPPSNMVITQKTIHIPEVIDSEVDQLISQLKLLKETYGENPSFHSVQTDDYIIIDGEKLNKEGALSMLVNYTGMIGRGVCTAGKSTYWMMGTVVQLASFVGLGFSIYSNPGTAALLLLGRISLRATIGI
ncbi:MAG: hypothetical protein AAGG81_09160 [Chlamydiota bacterium]